METKGIGVMGDEREGEAKGIAARESERGKGHSRQRRSVCTGDYIRSVFTAKRRSLVERNECNRDLRTTVRLLRKLMVTTMELQIMVFRCETYGRLAAPRVWI